MAKLLAPNGKPSNLTPEQYKLVRLPEFKAWFGDWENDPENASKVVDENGEPKVVGRKDFERIYDYREEYFTFFAEKKDVKYFNEFGEYDTYTFLNIKNPLIIDYGDSWANIPYDVIQKVFSKNDLVKFINNEWSENFKSWEEYIATLEDGYEPYLFTSDSVASYVKKQKINDGVIIYEIGETANASVITNDFIVFNSNQIKLADGSNTTFDGSNPDIRYAGGGETDEKEFVIQELDKDYKEVFQVRGYKNIGGSDFFFSRLKYSEQNVFTIELPSGKEIGRATLDEKENYLINIRIDENYRRKGLGLNLYNFIEYVTGKKLKPSPIKISQEAQALWIKRNPDILFKEGGLIAPNGKPSNLSPEQYELVRTPAFKEWFGDWENDPENASKVVDEETKEPLVVYHGYLVGGGAGRKFYEFKKLPAFFSKTKKFAYEYASTKSMDGGIDADIDTYACFLNIRKLFDSKNKENIKLAEKQLPEKIRVSHGTMWFLNADIPKEEVIEQMIGIITIQTDDLLVKDILSSNVGDIIAEKVSASQYENKILFYKDEDWAYITDERNFNEVVENEVAEFIYKENTKPFETGIKYRSKNIKKFTFNEETYSYELNKDPLFLEYLNEVEKRKKYYIDNILNLLKEYGETIKAKNGNPYRDYFYVRKINLKTYKTTTKNNWTMFENETLQKFLIDNNFGGWCAFETGDKTYGVYNANNIKLADGSNTTFDSKNNDIRFDEGGSISLSLLEKANKISNTNEYINCDAFCHRMVDNKLFKNEFDVIEFKNNTKKTFDNQYNHLIKILKVGDIIGFGEKDNVRHYAIYLGYDDVIEVEMWGKKPRKFSLKKNFYNYESIAFIYREKNNNDIRYTKGGKLNKGGDCYYMAGQLILNNEFLENKIDYIGTPYLVHAEVQGQGAISNLRYGHAWIEDDIFVYDYSNNRKIVLPKDFYYRIGDIKTNNPKKYRKYNFEQAKRKMLETKNYGCWDLEVEYKNGGAINNNLKKEQVNKTIFHKSNPMFRQSILKKGLIPKAKSETWLSDTAIDGKVIFATNTSDINKLFDSGYDDDIYEINTTGLNNKWYLDPNFSWSDKYNHIITFEPIPLSAIKLIYKGSGKSNDEYKNGGDVSNEIEKISKSVVNDLGEQYSENDYLGKCKEISEEIAVRLNKIKIEAIPMRIIDGEDKKYNSPVFNHAYTFLPKSNQIIDTQIWQLEGQPDNLKTRKVLFNWDDYNNLVELYQVEPISDWENRFSDGGEIIINPTEIECHKCHWHWKVKDGGDDLFICHKCYTDNTKFYKFEGLEGEKILDTISYKKGGRTMAKTYSPNNLYHFTSIDALKGILQAEYIEGYEGSVLDEEEGATISTTTDKDYRKKQHDINAELVILLNKDEIVKQYEVLPIRDYGYEEMQIRKFLKQGYSQTDAEYMANENQEIIKTEKLPIDFIDSIIFFKSPSSQTISLLESKKIPYTENDFKKGGRTISQTPAPKKDQIKGSDKNKEGSAKDLTSAKKIKFADDVLEKIQNSVDKHNKKHSNKKITIDSAKAVVRRGMGAYSSTHRPTISGGNENSRVAWGLARLNAFIYKIVNGKSKSGKYSQDNDLIEELGYKVEKYEIGGIFQGTPYDFNAYSTEYMGTGEGNQSFGWGLYFTDQKSIAERYAFTPNENSLYINGVSLNNSKQFTQEEKDTILNIWRELWQMGYSKTSNDYLFEFLNEIEQKSILLDIEDESVFDKETIIEINENAKFYNALYDKLKKLDLQINSNVVSVTLFKGKNPNEYDLLEFNKPVNNIQINKIENQAKKEGILIDDEKELKWFRNKLQDGSMIYDWLRQQFSKDYHYIPKSADKQASLFLLRAGIDGIKYKSGTLSGFEDEEGYNYVIFDSDDVTIENKEKYKNGGELENEQFENSALFFGGFFTGIQRQGVGKSIINDIFKNNPKLENILLYTQQDAIGFWEKVGGEIIKQGNDKSGTHRYYVKINRNSITKSKNIKELRVSYKNIDTNKAEISKGEYSIKYGRQKIGFFFVDDLGTIKTDPKKIILNSDNKEKYADGGDIQAYEEAMGISEFKEGGEAKPKKVYLSIPIESEYKDILNEKGLDDGSKLRNYQEKTFEDLQSGKLVGVIGVSSSPHNVGEWFYHRNCLIVMKYDEFVKLNDFTIFDYDNPEQLMADDMKLLNRLYQNKRDENTDEETLKAQRRNILQNVLGKFKQPFDIANKKEPNLSKKQGLYRIEHFLEESYKFINWIVNNNNILNSSDDLAEKIIEYHYSDDSNYISTFYGNTEDKNIDKKYILPFVIEMIKSAGNVFKSEQEIYLNNKILNIPIDSQLFFKNEKERKSNLLELIDKYKLREKYSVYFVKHQDIQKYSSLASQKRDNIAREKFNSDRKELEIKKDAVVHELLYFFLGQSLKSFKEIIEKEIAEYSDSTLFYYDYDEERKEIDWYGIILVQAIINKYIEIIQNNWKQFISTKDVKDITIHSFYDFQNNSNRELNKYFEENKLELEKINDYHNINGNWLSEYRIEYWLKKSVDDYQDMPEWIDHKELAKMYLEKMDAQMYRYYSEQEIPLFSKYNEGGQIKLADASNSKFDGNNPDIRFDNGGEADEPTNFWGSEAGGVLVYCSTTDRYLILLRSDNVLEPNTWGIISGKLDDDETNVEDAVLREAEEETGYKLGNLIPSFIFEKPNFKFHNFVSIINEEFTPELNWENSHYKWVKLNEMPDNLHFGLKLLLQKEDLPKLVKKHQMENEILIVDMNMYRYNTSVNFKNKEIPLKLNSPKNEIDFIEWAEENNIEFEQWGDTEMIDSSWGYTFEIPLFKYIEYMKTEKFYTGGELKKGIKTEMEHKDTISKIKTGNFSVKQSAKMIAKDHLKENDKYYTNLSEMESQFEEGGKVISIKSKKGDIKISLDENWYSDDTKVELVPVSELIKFREFDRKVKPKYNQDNSRDNINHLKYMFQKDGVKEPLIIEYSAQDNSVLLIEGNHRINSAIDLGMEYLPARVVLRKYGKYSPEKLKSTMEVYGIKANSSNYIPSELKPSQIGIEGTLPITYAEGGIIEGRLHSECGDDGCGRKFQVGEDGNIIEAERDEAVIVAEAFDDRETHTIEGTPSEIASALNVLGGGKNFDSGAEIIENNKKNELLKSKIQAKDTDVADIIDSGSIIINRRSMADEKKYKVTGTTKQIASAINSVDGNGVVIEAGAEIKKIK